MNEMDCHGTEIVDVNWYCELWEFIDFCFVDSPVVGVEPVVS
jgi:hypothetical protein